MITLLNAAAAATLMLTAQQASVQTGPGLINQLFDNMVSAIRAQHGVEAIEESGANFEMANGAEADTVMELEGGDYLIAGVCDESCRDVNMRVATLDGALIGEDMLEDDAPVVTFKANPGTPYRIQITMPRCIVQNCLVEVRAFRLQQ